MANKTYRITVSKLVEASAADVWATWTDEAKYRAVHDSFRAELDFREGGQGRIVYFEGKDAGETILYREIVPEQRLRYCWEGSEDYPFTLELEADGDATRVSITQDCREDPQWIETCLRGWAWILDSLDHYLRTGKGIAGSEWEKEHRRFTIAKVEPEA